MTLLVISPDYASHLFPLAALARAWSDAGVRVVVATGTAVAPLVDSFGFDWVHLRLARGSNPGVIRAEDQPPGEDENLRAFFAATRDGMVATLRYQADARRNDLLWEPVSTGRAVQRIVDEVTPSQVLVDHLAFSAALALRAAGVPYGDVVLGHPSALPVGDEVYGYPTAWPSCLRPDVVALAELRARCELVRDEFTAAWNEALFALDPGAAPVDDAFAARGDHVLLSYPAELHPPARTPLLPPHTFLGSSVREDVPPDDVAEWLEADGNDRPVVYVSFGSFLSARHDVLAAVLRGLRRLDVRVAVATGSAPVERLGVLPPDWLVRSFLPQVAILRRARLAVSHGGNNSVTEALSSGVPMVLLPFSTDQFAGAAGVEAAGLGAVLDPNGVSPADVAATADAVLRGPAASAARALGGSLAASPGPQRAFAALGA